MDELVVSLSFLLRAFVPSWLRGCTLVCATSMLRRWSEIAARNRDLHHHEDATFKTSASGGTRARRSADLRCATGSTTADRSTRFRAERFDRCWSCRGCARTSDTHDPRFACRL